MSVKNIIERMAVPSGEPIYVDEGVAKLVKVEHVILPEFTAGPVTIGEPVKGAIAYIGASPIFVGPPPPKAPTKPAPKKDD